MEQIVIKIMKDKIDIHKAAGIIIHNKKLLVSRSKGKSFFISPGGKLEKDETSKQALVRELHEEFSIEVLESDLEEFGTFYAQATGTEDKRLEMEVFVVKKYSGKIEPSSEIEEVDWITSQVPKDMELGSIFEHEVVPRLKEKELIE